MAFADFQQGTVIDTGFGPQPDVNAMGLMIPHGLAGPAHGHPAVHAPGPMGSIGPGVPAARLASPATGGTSHQDWVNEFGNMHLADAAGPTTVNPRLVHPVMTPGNHLQRPNGAPFAMPIYGGAQPSLANGFGNPAMSAVAQQQPQDNLPMESAMDVEAFNRAFGEYDDAIFQSELAEWAEKQKSANQEFIEEQDKWMFKHGPVGAKPPTAQEMKAIDEDLEELAQEQENAKRRVDEDLARAAVSIVNSVSDNESFKFKNSRFFELMRRIGNHEVVIDGANFVDAATGETVETSATDDSGADTGATKQNNGQHDAAPTDSLA
jgi:hypothetical protein